MSLVVIDKVIVKVKYEFCHINLIMFLLKNSGFFGDFDRFL